MSLKSITHNLWRPWKALFLSALFPGLGQLYNGQRLKKCFYWQVFRRIGKNPLFFALSAASGTSLIALGLKIN